MCEKLISEARAALIKFEVPDQKKLLQALNQALHGENVLNLNPMEGDFLKVLHVIRDQLSHRCLVGYLLEYGTVLELYLPNQSPLCHEILRDGSQVPFNPRLFQLGRLLEGRERSSIEDCWTCLPGMAAFLWAQAYRHELRFLNAELHLPIHGILVNTCLLI